MDFAEPWRCAHGGIAGCADGLVRVIAEYWGYRIGRLSSFLSVFRRVLMSAFMPIFVYFVVQMVDGYLIVPMVAKAGG